MLDCGISCVSYFDSQDHHCGNSSKLCDQVTKSILACADFFPTFAICESGIKEAAALSSAEIQRILRHSSGRKHQNLTVSQRLRKIFNGYNTHRRQGYTWGLSIRSNSRYYKEKFTELQLTFLIVLCETRHKNNL